MIYKHTMIVDSKQIYYKLVRGAPTSYSYAI